MTIDELVNKYYENLNDSDLYIWNYISKINLKHVIIQLKNCLNVVTFQKRALFASQKNYPYRALVN